MSAGYLKPLLVLWLVAVPLLCGAAAAPRDAIIDDLMAEAGLPGVQAAVVGPDGIVWEQSFGNAILEVPGPRKAMRNDALLQSASMGKLLVTVSALQLVDRGVIRLDDDIDASVPVVVRNPAWPDVPITWRMLLTHTSSLADDESDALAGSDYFYGGDTRETLEAFIVATFAPAGPRHRDAATLFRAGKPGTERIYNNLAFDLIGLAIERRVGESLATHVGKAVLAPLGMRDTGYTLAGRPAGRFAVGYASLRTAAQGVRYEPADAYWAHRDPHAPVLQHAFTCPDYASGCLYTTAHDFAQLMQMFLGGGSAHGVRVLSTESAHLMASPSGFRNLDGWMQGLGMNGPLDLRGRQLWGHDGIDRGVATIFYFNPVTQRGVVAMANANNPEFTLSYALLDIGLHLLSRFEPP